MLLEGSALIGIQAAHKISVPAYSPLVYFSADVDRERVKYATDRRTDGNSGENNLYVITVFFMA